MILFSRIHSCSYSSISYQNSYPWNKHGVPNFFNPNSTPEIDFNPPQLHPNPSPRPAINFVDSRSPPPTSHADSTKRRLKFNQSHQRILLHSERPLCNCMTQNFSLILSLEIGSNRDSALGTTPQLATQVDEQAKLSFHESLLHRRVTPPREHVFARCFHGAVIGPPLVPPVCGHRFFPNQRLISIHVLIYIYICACVKQA